MPARRLGALTRGASLDVRKAPWKTILGEKLMSRAVVRQRSPV